MAAVPALAAKWAARWMQLPLPGDSETLSATRMYTSLCDAVARAERADRGASPGAGCSTASGQAPPGNLPGNLAWLRDALARNIPGATFTAPLHPGGMGCKIHGVDLRTPLSAGQAAFFGGRPPAFARWAP